MSNNLGSRTERGKKSMLSSVLGELVLKEEVRS